MCSEAGAINDSLSMKSVQKKILEKLNHRFPESEAIKILICDHRLSWIELTMTVDDSF